jgi:hypothetical protein
MKLKVKKSDGAKGFGFSDLLPVGETAVLYGDRCITVQGCRKILAYAPCEIRMQLKSSVLVIRGSDLICSCFSGGCTTLKGKILCVEYQKNGGVGQKRGKEGGRA